MAGKTDGRAAWTDAHIMGRATLAYWVATHRMSIIALTLGDAYESCAMVLLA